MKNFFFAAAVVLVWISNSFSANNARSLCPHVNIENGKSRIRPSGRSIKFTCYHGFTLIGNKYSTCVRGEWDTPIPVCVNSNCPPPEPVPEHLHMASMFNGAVLMYFCPSGYNLIGNAEIYCNGKHWNGTVPHCRETNTLPPTSCDFETPDLCWWEQDPTHDFDWRRHNFETPSSHIGTGPTFDHTLGRGRDGYYLYIEASGKLLNDTARIISPLYNSSLTENGCFSFWYHMYGSSIGTLNVYFKPEAEAPKLLFTRSGEQGKEWLHGMFKLPTVESNFQIIIEGVRGKTYISDIAVDDVAILQGEKCDVIIETPNVTERDDDQVEIVHAMQSCRGKCTNSFLGMPPSSYAAEICYCTVDCADFSLCCPDYFNYCVNDFSTDSADEPISATTLSSSRMNTTLKDVLTSRHNLISTTASHNVIPINSTDGIDPYVSQEKNSASSRMTTAAFNAETPFMTSTQKILPKNKSGECEFCYNDSNVVMHNTEQLFGQKMQLSIASIIGIVVGLLAAIAITGIIAFILLHGNNSSALSEDSDVRFLTSDEILDFNLARPSSGDHDEM